MKKIMSWMTQRLTTKKIFLILYCIILFHILLTVYLLQSSQLARKTEARNRIFQKIANTIYLLEATPVKNRQTALSAIDDPDITVSLSATPKYFVVIK